MLNCMIRLEKVVGNVCPTGSNENWHSTAIHDVKELGSCHWMIDGVRHGRCVEV